MLPTPEDATPSPLTLQAELDQTRQQLAAIVESSDDAIVSKTLDGIITSWNRGAERIFGYSADQVIGRPVSILLPPERPDEYPAIVERLRLGRHIDHYETERLTKDGRRIFVSIAVSPIRDESNTLVGTATVARDISDRRLVEDALRVSRDQLHTILQTIADGITVQDRAGHLLYANDVAARLSGFESAAALVSASQSEILGQFEVRDETGGPLARDQLPGRVAIQTGRPSEAVLRYRVLSTGEERWSSVRSAPVIDQGVKTRFAVSVFQDITARKREEARSRFLGRASELLAGSLDHEVTLPRLARLAVPELADSVTVDVVEADGSIRRLAYAYADPARLAWAQDMDRRYPIDPNAGTGVARVIRSGEAEFYPEIPQSLRDAAASDERLRLILNELGLASAIIVPLRARGRTLGAITCICAESGRHYDEADLRFAESLAHRAALALDNARLYRDAVSALQTRDEFLAAVSHDLRTPLTTIRGMTQLALRRLEHEAPPDPESAAASLASVDQAAERMATMIDGLLDLTRLESGRAVGLERQNTNLVQTVRSLAELHQRASPAREIRVEATAEELIGLWDPVRIERVLDNLLSNAIKYSPSGGAVAVEIGTEPDEATEAGWAWVSVQDEGIGIPEADLPRIFERFRRGSNVPMEVPGVGIGLAGAKQIVEQHEGTLTVESEEGKGSRFLLRLPLGTANP